jgi:HAD superfamily phosphatase
MSKPLLVFDMDGVLVEVTESYRETIQQTVKHFTGRPISREEIQDYKNEGIWNDDWQLSHHIIQKAGVSVPFEEMVEFFQGLFHGKDGRPGLILREVWVAQPGLLERLAERFQLAIFTGRLKWEAEFTLNRFTTVPFWPILGMEDVTEHKPAPEGLLKLLDQFPDKPMCYIGDTVADARCAQSAGVPFIGITSPANPRYVDTVFLFQEAKAVAIVDNINYLEEVLNQ